MPFTRRPPTPTSGRFPIPVAYPFIFKEGSAEQSYMIQIIADAQEARIIASERKLLDDLCVYRELLRIR